MYRSDSDTLYINNAVRFWGKLLECSQDLKDRWGQMFSAEDWASDAGLIIKAFDSIKYNEFMNCYDLLSKVVLLKSLIYEMLAKLVSIRRKILLYLSYRLYLFLCTL